VFPGGSTRVTRACKIVDLESGKEIDLARFLKEHPETQAPERPSYSNFCLHEDGLINFDPDGKMGGTFVLPEEMATIFQPNPVTAAFAR
jgi:hypothetical protein